MEGSRREKTTFPADFTGSRELKITPTVILSSLSPPFSLLSLLKEEFPPWACRLSDWVIDGFIRSRHPSFIDKIFQIDLRPHLPFPYNPLLMSLFLFLFSFLGIKCLFSFFSWGCGHTRAYVSQRPMGRKEAKLSGREDLKSLGLS